MLPAATFVLGDTTAEASELAAQVRRQQVSGATAIKFAEQLWNRDLSGYDPDGPFAAPRRGEVQLPHVRACTPCGAARHVRPAPVPRADGRPLSA